MSTAAEGKVLNPLTGKYVKEGGAAHRSFLKKMLSEGSADVPPQAQATASVVMPIVSTAKLDVETKEPRVVKKRTKQNDVKLAAVPNKKVKRDVRKETNKVAMLKKLSDEELDTLYLTLVRQSKKKKSQAKGAGVHENQDELLSGDISSDFEPLSDEERDEEELSHKLPQDDLDLACGQDFESETQDGVGDVDMDA